jgi:hypothetical protein
MCVHRGECSYIYEYLRLYYVSKKIWIDETCAFFPFYENWLSITISLSFYSLISLKIN